MAERTSSSITINGSRQEVMAVIADFPAYPQWAGQVKNAEVLEIGPNGRASRVRFAIDAGVLADEYVLRYEWTDDAAVHWQLAEPSAMLETMTGSYQLAETGAGATEVTYELAIDLKIPTIGLIRRRAQKIIIHTALNGLKERVEGGA